LRLEFLDLPCVAESKVKHPKEYKLSNPYTQSTGSFVFGKLNKNILVLGPGGPTMAHQTDEWIDIEDVVKAASIYVELAGWF